jgi:hypothetical protein
LREKKRTTKKSLTSVCSWQTRQTRASFPDMTPGEHFLPQVTDSQSALWTRHFTLLCKSIHRPCVNAVWPCVNKALFTSQIKGPDCGVLFVKTLSRTSHKTNMRFVFPCDNRRLKLGKPF